MSMHGKRYSGGGDLKFVVFVCKYKITYNSVAILCCLRRRNTTFNVESEALTMSFRESSCMTVNTRGKMFTSFHGGAIVELNW